MTRAKRDQRGRKHQQRSPDAQKRQVLLRKLKKQYGGNPPGFKNYNGYLLDDGIIDYEAVNMVVQGMRVVDLTYPEAKLAASKLLEKSKNHIVSRRTPGDPLNPAELVSVRLGVTLTRANTLLSSVAEDKREEKKNATM
jgi:hypothetical protein